MIRSRPGGEIALHDTAEKRFADPRKAAKADLNVAGDSAYLRGIRRNA